MSVKLEELKKGDSVGDPRDQFVGEFEDQGETEAMLKKHDLILRSGKNDPGKNAVVIVSGSITRLVNKQDFENNWVKNEGGDIPIL